MSFNPQGFQFTALPTNLRGKIQPNQLAVLWAIESYAGKNEHQSWPSLKTIADASCLSVRTVQKVVNQLVSLGWLQREHQKDEYGQKSNLYKVTVWHLANVPDPSIGPLGKSCHTPSTICHTPRQTTHPPLAPFANEPDTYKPDTKELNIYKTNTVGKKEKNSYSDDFEIFWKKYQAIKKRASGQNKSKAWQFYQKATKKKSSDLILAALNSAIKDQRTVEKNGGYAVCFPNCFRWLRDESYETFIAVDKSDTIKKKAPEPWAVDAPAGQPF